MAMSSGGEVMVVLANNSHIYEVSNFVDPRAKELNFIAGTLGIVFYVGFLPFLTLSFFVHKQDTDLDTSPVTAITIWSCEGGTVEVLAAAHGQLWVVGRDKVQPVRPSAPLMKVGDLGTAFFRHSTELTPYSYR